MLLLKGLKDNQFLTENKSVDEYGDRWEKLAKYRCNPWLDLEPFELKVKYLDLRPKRAKTVIKGFSPDEETVNYVFGSTSEPEKNRLALSFLRMFDEAGLPFRSNKIVYFGEAISRAAVFLAGSDLEHAISTIVRLEQTDNIKDWFDRHHVSRLSDAAVNRFFVLFSNSFVSAIERFQRTVGTETGETHLRRIKLFAELLSRLCFRLPPDQLETVFTFAVDIYQHPVFAQTFWLHKPVDVLFKRIFETMSPTDVLARMKRLLELPIPGEGGFRVAEKQEWVEPYERIRWTANFKLPTGFDRSNWNAAVENLLRIVRSGARETRDRAASRLETLYRIGALTVEETEEFARAIWSRTDPLTNLPIETNFPTWSFLLSLPIPNLDETKNLLRRHLTSQEFPRAVRRHVTDGRESVSVGMGSGRNLLVENIAQITLQPYSNEEDREKLIDWSPEETKKILDKAISLWEEQKSYLNRFAGQDMAGDKVRNQFLQLASLFALVLLPRLLNADSETKENIKRVLSEMQAENLFPLSAQPAKLFVAPEDPDEISAKLLKGVRSLIGETVGDAARGARNWLVSAEKGGLSAAFPERLLDELINIVVLRRQPGLLSVVKILAWTAEIIPETLGDQRLEDLITALDFLKTEAFSAGFAAPNGDENQIIREDEQASLQNACVRLAKAIKQQYESVGKAVPDTINFWHNVLNSSV